MKALYSIIIFSLIFFLGCNKDEDKHWKIDDTIITYKLVYNTNKQLEKCSFYKNDTLVYFITYHYYSDSLIEKAYKHDSILNYQKGYALDTLHRSIKGFYLNDLDNYVEISYSQSGFIDLLSFNRFDWRWSQQDNGNDIISGNFIDYYYSNTLNKICLPGNFYPEYVPIYTGMFGKVNQHLLEGFNMRPPGPGSIYNDVSLNYTFNSNGYVTQIKEYKKSYYRSDKAPKYGTISYIKYEYTFK